MTDKVKSAQLILKLYDLRREAVMREARNWFFTFNPASAEDVQRTAMGEHGGYFRMVTTYWDMACSFVNHGAIDAEMFADATGEQVFIYAKLQPFLEQLRAVGNPTYMQHLERAVMAMPQAEERLARVREMSKRVAEARAATSAERAEADAANA
jgi:CRISPR/Cas system Type II protein with McrA/HNH and RuvC-like nuclease domain